MRKNKQKIVDIEKGDCFSACLTSILDIPHDSKFPIGNDPNWSTKWHKFLYHFGITMLYEKDACWRQGYWIASVRSLNYPDTKITHAIVMRGDQVVFDPSTKKRYKTGESLLGKKLVQGGHYLEVIDATKLHKLAPLQKK